MAFGSTGLSAWDFAAEEEGERRLILGPKGGEAFGLGDLAGFHLHLNRAALAFAKKLHFSLSLPSTRGLPTKGVEFLRDEIFRVVAFIGTIVLTQNVGHGQSAQGSQQAGIKDEQFEKILLPVCIKGEVATVDDRMPENEPGSQQPVNHAGHSVVATQTGGGFLEDDLRSALTGMSRMEVTSAKAPSCLCKPFVRYFRQGQSTS